MPIQLRGLLTGLRTLDMFGHRPEMSFEGQTAFTTCIGAFCSVIVYILILFNTVMLTIQFNDGSKQNEKFNEKPIDRSSADPIPFQNDLFEVALMTLYPVPQDVGKLVAYQLEPSSVDPSSCKLESCSDQEWDARTRALEVTECKDVKKKEIFEYWASRAQI